MIGKVTRNPIRTKGDFGGSCSYEYCLEGEVLTFLYGDSKCLFIVLWREPVSNEIFVCDYTFGQQLQSNRKLPP
jgi:hypothetical protein